MADYERIMKALRNADAAGDTEGARRLAAMARAAQTEQAAPVSVDTAPTAPAQAQAPDVMPWDVPDARGVPGGTHSPQDQAVINSDAQFGKDGIVRSTNSVLSGANRGLAGVVDAPVHLTNWIADKVGLPEEWRGSGPAAAGLEAIGAIRDPDPKHPTLEKVGEVTGAGVGSVAGGALLNTAMQGASLTNALGNSRAVQVADNALSTVGNASSRAFAPAGGAGGIAGDAANYAKLLAAEGAAGVGSTVGGAGGRAVGERVGGDTGGAVGETLGSILGGITPAAVATGVSKLPSAVGARTAEDTGVSSAEILGALQRQGIEPSGGLVGNRGIAKAENVASSVPFLGSVVANKQARQVGQFGEAVQNTAARMRGYRSDEIPDSHTIGTKIQNAASEGLDTIKSNINSLEGNLGSRAAKANSAVDVSGVKQEIAALSAKSTPNQQATLNAAVRDLDAMRDVPIDAAKHQTMLQQQKVLTKNIRDVNKKLADAPQDTALKTQAKTMHGNLEKLNAEIDANLGVDYTRLRAWRTEIGQATQQGGIPGGNMAQTYKATTGATQDFADRAGMRQNFDDLMSAEAELYQRRGNLDTGGDIPLTQKITNMPSGDDVYRAVIQGGQQAPEKLDAIRRNMHPDQWAEISADVIEQMGRAKPGQGSSASDFSPETFLTNWNKLSARSKQIIAGDEMSALDDLAMSATAFRERGRTGNPSGTAGHLMTGTAAAGLLSSPKTTLTALTAGHLAGRAVASEKFAEMLASKAPKLADRLLPRLVGQAGRSAVINQERQ